MDRRELRERARQEFAKRVDAALARFGYDFARFSNGANREAGRFFFDEDSIADILHLFRGGFLNDAQDLMRSADRILAHQFDLLGYRGVNYGSEIDWHLDAVHGKRAPRLAFYRVPYLNFEEAGDAKITWELNRHQHLVLLAICYRLSGDERYAGEIVAQWRHWHARNRYPFGINWSSSLEAAFRAISWIWCYFLLENTAVMTEPLRRRWLAALAVSARHIERYLSTYFSPNTHLLGEGVALFFIGTLFPQMRHAQRWQRRGWAIVLRESRRQVRADGLHFEQSTYYHVYALDFFLHARILAARNGIRIPKQFDARIRSMLDALATLCRAGAPPKLGDDDGGRLFDGRRNRSNDLVEPLAVGAVLFSRGDYKAIARRPTMELLWLLGATGVEAWNSVKPVRPATASVAFPVSGLYCMSGQDGAEQMVVDAGPFGALHAGHGHADALSVCLSAHGVGLLIDPGTGDYVDTWGQRSNYRGTAAHNTLTIDDRDQSEGRGPFAWRSLPRVRAEQWIAADEFDLFRGSHDGYSSLDSRALHTRWVFSMKCGFWLVRDVVSGAGAHRLRVNWHLGPELERESERALVFSARGERALAIVPTQSHAWEEELREGCWSPAYGIEEPALVVSFSAVQTLPAEFACMLVSSSKIGSLHAAHRAQGGLHAYRYLTDDAEFVLIFSEDARSWTFGPLTSDAEFVCWKRAQSGEDKLALCNGSIACLDGRAVISRPGAVPWAAASVPHTERV